MTVGQRIRELRTNKDLSQGDIEKQTGMLRGYISRVEHGHTVPSVETLHRFAAALGVPVYQLFVTSADEMMPAAAGGSPAAAISRISGTATVDGPKARFLEQISSLADRMMETDRTFLLDFARKLAAHGPQPAETGEAADRLSKEAR